MLVGIVTLIISTIAVFNHQLVWLLAVFPGLYIAYAFFIAFSKAPQLKDSIHLTHSEKEAWQQHHAFFRFPFAARNMAGALSMLQFISIILAIAFAVTGAYWGLAFALGWFICGLPTPRLNPTASVVPEAQKGTPWAIERVKALESLQEKLNNPDRQPETHTKPITTKPVTHTKPTPAKSVKTEEREKFKGLTQQQTADLYRIKERIDKRGNQPVIAVMATMPSITRKLLELRKVEIPSNKTHFVGVVSFTGKNVAFTFLDYKMSGDMHHTVLLMTTEEVRKVLLNDKGTTMIIRDRKDEEASFVSILEGDSFKDLAQTVSDNLPHLYG
jgi:hypothetical protein